MKKLKFKKSLLSLALGLVFTLCSMPAINLSSIFTANAAATDVYTKHETVDVNGDFATSTSSVPEKWSVKEEYSNTNNGDSTSFKGVIEFEAKDWKSEQEKINNNITDVLGAHLSLEYPDEQAKQAILNAIKLDLPAIINPLVNNFDLEDQDKTQKMLMISAGKTYTKYMEGTTPDLASENRTAFVSYTSNDFELAAYSYYKISVWVKTTNGATASIAIGGDIDKDGFNAITTTPSGADVTYYTYKLSKGTSTETFISTTAPTSLAISYDGLDYAYDSTSESFLPTSSEEAYKNYSIKYENISETTNSTDWTQYSFYISTVNKTNINLSLNLGSESAKSGGIVFFDDVKVEKIQLMDFVNSKLEPASKTIVYDERELLTNDPASRDYTNVFDFETEKGWRWKTIEGGTKPGMEISLVEESTIDNIIDTFPDTNTDGVNKVLKVENGVASVNNILSNELTFEQFGYYRVSLWAQSMEKSASLVVNLISDATGSEIKATSKTSPYTASRNNADSTSITNYWVEYVFYVKGSPIEDTTAYFNIEISKNTTVYFDNVVTEKITKKDYEDSKGTLLDLSKVTYSANLTPVTNGRFNDYDNVEYKDYSKPLPPSSWTSTKKETVYVYYDDIADKEFTKAYFKEDLTFSADEKTITLSAKEYTLSADGKTYNHTNTSNIVEKIEKVSDVEFAYKVSKGGYYNEKYDLTIDSNVNAGIVSGYKTPINGYTANALMIESSSADTFSYKSSAIKFSTNAVLYKIMIDVMTDASAKATLKLVDASNNVFAILTDINTDNSWETYEFYVSSGYESKELFLELTLDDTTGKIYFKKIVYNTVTNTTLLDECKTLSPTEIREKNVALVDLAKESFVEHELELNATTKLYDTKLYTSTSSNKGVYGVLDTKHKDALYSSIEPKDAEKSSYVFVVKNTSGQSTVLKSIKTFSTVKKGYSKISIIAKVSGLEEGKTASITFNKSGTTFFVTESEYTEYILYIDNSTIDSLYTTDYTISLDGAGELIIDSISLTKETSLDTAKSENNDGKDSDTVKFISTEAPKEGEENTQEPTTEEEDEITEDKNRTLEILMAVLSSLLLVAAIVFAIVFTRLKAIKKPKKDNKSNKVSATVDDSQKGFI